MLFGVSRHIVDWLILKKTVNEEDRELYEYAAYNLIFTSVPLGVFLLICGIMGCFVKGLLLLTALLAVRRYSGGFHAKTPFRCICISSVMLAVCLVCSNLAENGLFVGIATAISAMGVFILSPVDSENRRLDAEEKRRYRLLARRNVCVLCLLYMVCTIAGCHSFAVCLAIGIIAGALMQIVCIPKLLKQKNKNSVGHLKTVLKK